MIRTHLFRPLRLSLLAAIGAASTAACGSSIEADDDGGSGGAGTGGTTGTGAGVTFTHCDGAEAILQPDGSESGFNECPDGTKYRVAAVACDTEQNGTACQGDEESTSCLTDADCTGGSNGRCFHTEWAGPAGTTTSCGCSYSCASDADCSEDQVCVCAGVAGRSQCTSATCETNDDCPSSECALSVYDDGCGVTTSLHCRTALDECRTAEDCPGDTFDIQCAVDYDSDRFACVSSNCAIGRPLLVNGRARATQAIARDDWRVVEVSPDTEGLSPEVIEALASRWQEVAAMEHASVASFARFTLQLMALGAPADLLAETQQAATDEIGHARVAYSIASAYAGRPLGPDALDLADVSIETDRAAVLRGLIEEACVGEAIGVAEALAFADAATDPAIAAVLSRIAEEEERHAALAWRALHWMLEGADEEMLTIARQSFARATRDMRHDPIVEGPVAPELGLWSGAQIGSVRRRALDEVVGPCAQALFAGPVGSPKPSPELHVVA